ncbi:hypothetical protein GCM10022393_14150 [Aquimarina addita]|uniref:DUF805 domain-containing protein n=1 Tax=Aquimarina addita TaxID=870485 RepID=A0ABP7XFD8_9FLAO
MNWYIKVLENYVGFTGRARRSEYWFFTLFNMLFAILAMILDNVFGIAVDGVGYGPIFGIYILAMLLPGLAVTVRRLHDTGKSGWMYFVSLIPFVGSIWLLILMATDSDYGSNEYGPNPKGIGEDTEVAVAENEVASSGDSILMFVIIWSFISTLFYASLRYVISDAYESNWFQIVSTFSRLIWSVIPLALAFAVKDKSKRTLLFIFGGICFLIKIGELLYDFVRIYV